MDKEWCGVCRRSVSYRPHFLACLFDDERVPCRRPRDDIVGRLLDDPEEQLNEHRRGSEVEHVLILLNSSFFAVANWLVFVLGAHDPTSMNPCLIIRRQTQMIQSVAQGLGSGAPFYG